MLEEYMKKTESEYYPPVENLLDLIYEHYTENNPVEKNTAARKVAKAKEKKLEEWLRSDCGRRCVPRYQPCRSAGTGKTVKKAKEKRARRIRLFQGVVRRRPPQFMFILYHMQGEYASDFTNC